MSLHPQTQSLCSTSWILNPVEFWTYHMILPLRQYNQCSCWTSRILNIATWSHICCPGRIITLMTHFLYVCRVGQDHQSILDDLSGWPLRTQVKYLLCVRWIGLDHQLILDDLSGWPVRTPVEYLVYIRRIGQDQQSILDGPDKLANIQLQSGWSSQMRNGY